LPRLLDDEEAVDDESGLVWCEDVDEAEGLRSCLVPAAAAAAVEGAPLD